MKEEELVTIQQKSEIEEAIVYFQQMQSLNKVMSTWLDDIESQMGRAGNTTGYFKISICSKSLQRPKPGSATFHTY